MGSINNNADYNQLAYPLPYDIEKEDQIIAILSEGGYQQEIILSNLTPDDFYKSENRIIIEAAVELKRNGITIDLLSLNDQLRKNKKIDFKSVMSYLTNVNSMLGFSSNVEYHVNFIKDLSIARKAIELFYKKIQTVQLFEKSAKEILSETIKESESLLGRLVKNNTISFKNQYLEVLKSLGTKGSEFLGLTTGFKSIDFLTSGLCAPDLTVLAAGPGEGKSTFALNIAHHIALNEGKVLFFSYEMKANQLIYKIISNETNTNVLDVRKGNLSDGYEHNVLRRMPF